MPDTIEFSNNQIALTLETNIMLFAFPLHVDNSMLGVSAVEVRNEVPRIIFNNDYEVDSGESVNTRKAYIFP